jgi:hypothetical protein
MGIVLACVCLALVTQAPEVRNMSSAGAYLLAAFVYLVWGAAVGVLGCAAAWSWVNA